MGAACAAAPDPHTRDIRVQPAPSLQSVREKTPHSRQSVLLGSHLSVSQAEPQQVWKWNEGPVETLCHHIPEKPLAKCLSNPL